jgi:hypothetical protein
MDVIALTVFGFFLLGFILYWRFRHRGKVESFLEHNQNVMPLFRERSAKIKYDILQELLNDDLNGLKELEKLRLDYTEGRIDVEKYEAELSNLQEQHIKH